MPAFRDEADALATALGIGAVDVDEVIDWADAQITSRDAPHWTLCEVATSRGRYPQDVASILRQVPGQSDPLAVRSLLIVLMARKLRQDESRAHRLASALFQMASAGEIEDPELREVALWAWDALDLATYGYTPESPSQVVEQMREALTKAALTAAERGSDWTGGGA